MSGSVAALKVGYAPLRPRLILLSCLTLLTACSAIMERQVGNLSDGIATAIRSQNDTQLVAESLPTYILLTEAMIANSSDDNGALHRSAAELYSAYLLTQDDGINPQRKSRLLTRSFEHAVSAFCPSRPPLCPVTTVDYQRWEAGMAASSAAQVPALFTLAVSWLALIEHESADWNRVAELPRVKLLLDTVVRLDESYQGGLAHLYLGGLATLLPPALGGKPEVGRAHFERAIALSGGDNLMAKVVYAERYARLVFDRELHHRLLTEVLESPTDSDKYALVNTLARQRAKILLTEENEYFL